MAFCFGVFVSRLFGALNHTSHSLNRRELRQSLPSDSVVEKPRKQQDTDDPNRHHSTFNVAERSSPSSHSYRHSQWQTSHGRDHPHILQHSQAPPLVHFQPFPDSLPYQKQSTDRGLFQHDLATPLRQPPGEYANLTPDTIHSWSSSSQGAGNHHWRVYTGSTSTMPSYVPGAERSVPLINSAMRRTPFPAYPRNEGFDNNVQYQNSDSQKTSLNEGIIRDDINMSFNDIGGRQVYNHPRASGPRPIPIYSHSAPASDARDYGLVSSDRMLRYFEV